MNPLMYRQPRFPIIPYPIPGVLPHRREVNDEEDLATVALQIQKKRFYVDVKKNWRGRFMKIAEVVSSLIDCAALNLPGPKAFRIDNRTLYFDSVSNRYGVFLRISQVWASSRTAITIPERSLNRFRDIINELAERISSSSVKEEEDSGDNEKDMAHSAEETPSKTPNSDIPAD
ncbi:hypothetical protein SprV_0200774800 [Sparganum proliferum]